MPNYNGRGGGPKKHDGKIADKVSAPAVSFFCTGRVDSGNPSAQNA